MHLRWLCGVSGIMICAVFLKVNCQLTYSLPLQSGNKENSKAVSLKKHYSDDLQYLDKKVSNRGVLKSQN
jgi:hypothetical protein